MTPNKRKNSPVRLEDIYDQNVNIISQNKVISDKIENLVKKQDKTDEIIKKCENKITKLSDRQIKIDTRINTLEQIQLSCVMEIKGVKDEINKSEIKNYVCNLINSYGADYDQSVIEYAYQKSIKPKMNEKNKFMIITVKFINDYVKNDIMKKKFSVKNEKGIYFEHALTPYNRSLLMKARSVRKELNLPIVFFRDGKIHMKQKKEDKSTLIRTFEDIEKILCRDENNESTEEFQLCNDDPTRKEQAASSSRINSGINVSNKKFSIFQLNVRGLNEINKFQVLKSSLHTMNHAPDIIALSEVKLKPNFPLGIYNWNGYAQFSALRDSKNSKGGIVVYVKEDINHTLVSIHSSKFELIVLKIEIVKKFFVTLITIYRPPNGDNFSEFLVELERNIIAAKGNIIIVGDINVDWLSNSYDKERYKSLLSSYEIDVINNEATRPISGKLIDHVATNFHTTKKIQNFTIDQDNWFTDHSAILSIIDVYNEKEKFGWVTREKINFSELENNFIIPNVENIVDVNKLAKLIVDATKNAMNACTTKKSIKMKNPSKIGQHVNAELLELIQEKDKLRKKLKNNDNDENRRKYMKVCDRFKLLNEKLYDNYIKEKLDNKDIEGTWRGLNEILGRRKNLKSEVSELMLDNKIMIKNAKDIANKFNIDFTNDDSSNHDNPTSDSSNYPTNSQKSLFLFQTNEEEICEIIDSLKSNSAAGPDEVSPKVVKKLKFFLVPLIVILTNLIFSLGNFPDVFKEAIVRPIYKGGEKTLTNNYRPISMLNVYAKIIEKVIHNRILSYVEKNKILYNSQYGFRKKSGTDNAAHEVVNYIRNELDKGRKVSAVFIDLKKAFDLVHHEVLVSVLESIGIRGIPLSLLKNYLNKRYQVVKVNGECSDKREIKRGVIQGSVLGSLFFLIVINAISQLKIRGKLILYADDAVLLNSFDKNECIMSEVRENMEKILNFFSMRKLILNAEKTVFMVFQSNSKKDKTPLEIQINDECVIKKVEKFKYLGLHLDPNLRYDQHIKSIHGKVAKAVGMLWKLGKKIPMHCRKLIYFSLIHSHLNYMIAIWGTANNSLIEPLQVLQNRGIRNVFNYDSRHNRVDMYQKANILPIRALCYSRIAEFVYKCVNNLTISPLSFETCGGRTRQKFWLKEKKYTNSFGKLSLETIGPKILNSLPESIKKSQTTLTLKNNLKKHILSSELINIIMGGKLLKKIFRES